MTINASHFSDRGFRFALGQHVRVVLALMLRDIQTRFGASYFGFLVGLILPLAHVSIILTVYMLLGRRAPIGTDVMLYLSSAIVPFVLWSYTHQKVSQAFAQNRTLTSFPVVRLIDILVARALVEALNATLIVVVIASTFTLLGKDLFLADPHGILLTLSLAYLYGVSTGFLFGMLSMLNPALLIFGFLLIPLNWVTCGIFFIPDGLPASIREVVAFFPLAHVVDYGRTSLYSSYISDFYSLSYVIAITGTVLIGCLLGKKLLRPIMK